MSEKVVLPKVVAEAIEYYRSQGLGSASIASIAVTSAGIGRERPLVDFVIQAADNSEKIMSALVNGYTVEATPEEMVRNYYEIEMTLLAHLGKYDGAYHEGTTSAIKETLNLLGIKIEGVNA